MRIKLIKKSIPLYSGKDTIRVLAYDGEWPSVEDALNWVGDAMETSLQNAANVAYCAAHMYTNETGVQSAVSDFRHLAENTSFSMGETKDGGYSVTVEAPGVRATFSADPSSTANQDSIVVKDTIPLGGGNLGMEVSIKKPN